MPNWADIHPAVVHFPFALLFIAPLFLLLGAVFKKPDLKTAFLILLVLGTVSILVAAATGEAAGEKITVINDDLLETLDDHESAAEAARTIFVIASIIAIAWHFLRNRASFIPGQIKGIAVFLFVCLYGFGLITLSAAAHHGGGLVHHHGVHSGLFKEAK